MLLVFGLDFIFGLIFLSIVSFISAFEQTKDEVEYSATLKFYKIIHYGRIR
jgi:hypothetical protein